MPRADLSTDLHGKSRAGNRVGWIDVARGLGIILVVAGHAAGGLIDASASQATGWLRYAFLAIYTFHMPVFFFLAGLFVVQRLQRGLPNFFTGLLTTIVYPYFLWSILQFSIIYALGSWVNHPVEGYFGTILALPWQTVSQFWFLHALFLIHLIGIAGWSVGGRYAVLGLAVALKLATMFIPSTAALSLAAGNAPYYAIGVVLGWERASALLYDSSTRTRLLTIASAIVAIMLLSWHANDVQNLLRVETASSAGIARIAWMPAMLPATILGGAALMMIAGTISRSGGVIADRLEWIGKMSMPIFLMHILFIAGTRILLGRLLGISGVAILPILMFMGLAGPLLAKMIADRLRFSKALGLG